MKKPTYITLLDNIRLTKIFFYLLVTFSFLSFYVPQQEFTSSALTLFSVNSFLYGFYIAPILGAQKSRIEALHGIVRAETNALFSMAIKLRRLNGKNKNHAREMLDDYADAVVDERKPGAGELEYERMISFCLDNKADDKEATDKLLDDLVANQTNRTNLSMQLSNRVFSNEWIIMTILFSITIGFILSINIGDTPLLHVIRALLCTGLTMLVIILAKLSTLTHKKAKQIWLPLSKLADSNFRRFD